MASGAIVRQNEGTEAMDVRSGGQMNFGLALSSWRSSEELIQTSLFTDTAVQADCVLYTRACHPGQAVPGGCDSSFPEVSSPLMKEPSFHAPLGVQAPRKAVICGLRR